MGTHGPLYTVTNEILYFIVDGVLLQLPTEIAFVAAIILTPFMYIISFLNTLFGFIGL